MDESDYITKEDMIKRLKELPDGALLCVTQNGYYAEGRYASILYPQLVSVESVFPNGLYSIGHSSQDY